MLVEIIAGNHGPLDAETIPRVMRRLYDLGIKPDWWKLEPQTDAAAWQNIDRLIDERDPYCRGVVILGLNAPEQELLDSFKTAQAAKHVKGFAVGRTIFADAADQWLKGDFTDDQAVTDMAERFARLTQAWIGMKS